MPTYVEMQGQRDEHLKIESRSSITRKLLTKATHLQIMFHRSILTNVLKTQQFSGRPGLMEFKRFNVVPAIMIMSGEKTRGHPVSSTGCIPSYILSGI